MNCVIACDVKTMHHLDYNHEITTWKYSSYRCPVFFFFLNVKVRFILLVAFEWKSLRTPSTLICFDSFQLSIALFAC